jgi:hypothetical protein
MAVFGLDPGAAIPRFPRSAAATESGRGEGSMKNKLRPAGVDGRDNPGPDGACRSNV